MRIDCRIRYYNIPFGNLHMSSLLNCYFFQWDRLIVKSSIAENKQFLRLCDIFNVQKWIMSIKVTKY